MGLERRRRHGGDPAYSEVDEIKHLAEVRRLRKAVGTTSHAMRHAQQRRQSDLDVADGLARNGAAPRSRRFVRA